MAKVFDGIDDQARAWIAERELFFVGSAPLSGEGHVNLSPKGPIGTLRVLDPQTAAYLDVIGSGAETIAHLRENGRIVIMLCAFSGPPRILRLHGRGEVVLAGDGGFDALAARCDFDEPEAPAYRRAIVVVHVHRVADSCGYGVPLMRPEGLRPHGDAWAAKKLRVGGPQALLDYQREKNTVSLDGLPAVSLDGDGTGVGVSERGAPAAAVEVKVRDNGPYRVTGPLRLIDAEGGEFGLPEGESIVLCRCGHSQTKPFCDRSHRDAEFVSCERAGGAPATGPLA